jgi:hypothetical protein
VEVDAISADLGQPAHGFDRPGKTQLEVPAALRPRLAKLAAEIFRGARTDLDKLQALSAWYGREGFSASTQVEERPGGATSLSPLERFLFVEKQGHCELFASAAARHVEALLKSGDFLSAWAAVRGQYQASDSTPGFALLAAEALGGLGYHAEADTAYGRYLATAGEADGERDRVLYASAWNLRKLTRNADAATRFDELVRTQPKSRYRADAAYRAASPVPRG